MEDDTDHTVDVDISILHDDEGLPIRYLQSTFLTLPAVKQNAQILHIGCGKNDLNQSDKWDCVNMPFMCILKPNK